MLIDGGEKMIKVFSYIGAVVLALFYPLACISTNLDPKTGQYLGGYFGPHSLGFTVLRYLIVSAIIILLTYLNRNKEKLFTVILPCELAAVSIYGYLEHFHFHHFLYNFAYCLWYGAAVSVASGALFLAATVFLKDSYKTFFKTFWLAYFLIYALIFYVSFIRQPDSFSFSVNTEIGNGTLQYFSYLMRNLNDAYMALICIGNIFIFLPLPFIIKAINFKINDALIFLICMLVPLAVEGYQYDIILNLTGFILGFILMRIIYNKKIKASQQ